MASLFDTLQANAFRAGIKARTRASRKWFSTNVKNLQVSRSALLRDTALKTTNVPFVVVCICIFMTLSSKQHYHIMIDFH